MTVTVSRQKLLALMSNRQREIMDRIQDLVDLEKARKKYGREIEGYYHRYKATLMKEAEELIGRSGHDPEQKGGSKCFLI